MQEMTITQVSRSLGISTRMLRYYEKTGLIESFRREDYAYRMYDKEAVTKLKKILLLRKLRISLSQIKIILNSPDAVGAISVFQQNMDELDIEISALSTIRDILKRFCDALSSKTGLEFPGLPVDDHETLALIASLPRVTIHFKEDQNMKKETNQAPKLNDMRIITLPPMVIAAYRYEGDEPEAHVHTVMNQFVRDSGLLEKKPDLRHFGFNSPNPKDETGYHGYQVWVTIPEDMEVPAPLTKRQFAGGLYAVHMIPFGNFQEWEWMFQWVQKNADYEFAGDMSDQENMCGLMEEHLNYTSHVFLDDHEPEGTQLDLYMPIRTVKL